MANDALAGVGVLVTRPARQATRLAQAISAHGGSPVMFPVIEIIARDAAAVDACVRGLPDPDITIFVSQNAVQHGLAYAQEDTIAAVGPATAAAIEAAGRSVDILSGDGYDSESLLATDALQNVDGKVVRIIRGNTGRELIANTLRDRGAVVDYLEVYARRAPNHSSTDLEQIEQLWRNGDVNIVTVMSVESLRNLVAILPKWCGEALHRTPLVTPAKRVIKEVQDRFPGIPTTLANGPQARDMIDAILACNETRSGQIP